MTPAERALSDRATRVGPASVARISRLDLNPTEAFVLSRVTRQMPVSEMLLVSGLDEANALQALLNLLTKGALVIGEQTATIPPPGAGQTAESLIVNRALQEDVDLPIEKREQVLRLFHGRERLSHYRMLGVAPNASTEEIRAAYLQRSREFHPDLFFRKNLGTYGPKLQDIFRRMTNAQDVLMNPTERARYDREFQSFDSEELEAITRREVGRIEDEQRARTRRSHLLQGKGFARLTLARSAMAAGIAALGKADFPKALQEFQRALDLDPKLEEARKKMQETRDLANQERVDNAIKQAIEKARDGQHESALRTLKSAMQADPTNYRIYSTAAAVILRSGGELREARMHAQRAIDLGDKSGRAYTLLGEILLGLGEKKAGKAALQTAAEMGDSKARSLLKG